MFEDRDRLSVRSHKRLWNWDHSSAVGEDPNDVTSSLRCQRDHRNTAAMSWTKRADSNSESKAATGEAEGASVVSESVKE
jgi:hypothetical protein